MVDNRRDDWPVQKMVLRSFAGAMETARRVGAPVEIVQVRETTGFSYMLRVYLQWRSRKAVIDFFSQR